MNRDEATYILRAYRVDGQDANDPQFRKALELVRLDPELARWFAEEQAVDIRVAHKLRAFPVPSDLKSQLLAVRKIVTLPAWWQRRGWQVAAAAGVALLVTISVLFIRLATPADFACGQSSFAQYRDTMADFAGNKLWRLDLNSPDVKEVRRWLTQKDAPGDLQLPAGLDGRPSVGCRVLNWGGKKVALVCFELANHEKAHLLVIDRDALSDAPAESPQFAQTGKIATLSWSRDGKTYVLACKGGTQSELLGLL